MKKLWLVMGLFWFSIATYSQERSIKDIAGTWLAVNEKDAGLEVTDSTRIVLVYGADKKEVIASSFDFTKSPIRFNFSVKEGQRELKMHSLLLFINNDLLQWQVFDGDVQPAVFSTNQGDLMYLSRKK